MILNLALFIAFVFMGRIIMDRVKYFKKKSPRSLSLQGDLIFIYAFVSGVVVSVPFFPFPLRRARLLV